jgi:hypothetical protein
MQKLGMSHPPSQAELSQIYGEQAPDFNVLERQSVNANMSNMQQVEEKTFDITNFWEACCKIPCACSWRKKLLSLKEDQMEITEKNDSIHMPYASMGSVDFQRSCCCFYSVNDESPGCGCQKEKVLELADELQKRKVLRGNVAQVKMLEAMQSSTRQMNVEADLIMKNEGIAYPPSQETITKVWGGVAPVGLRNPVAAPHVGESKHFDTQEYDITNWWDCVTNCLQLKGPLKRKMTLEPEEMFIETTDWCSTRNERTPYAQLASVEVETMCLCCSVIPDVAHPRCGCAKEYVETIAADLQERKVKRGGIAQFKMQENILNEMLKLSCKADLICDVAKVPAKAPRQELMAAATVVAPVGLGACLHRVAH